MSDALSAVFTIYTGVRDSSGGNARLLRWVPLAACLPVRRREAPYTDTGRQATRDTQPPILSRTLYTALSEAVHRRDADAPHRMRRDRALILLLSPPAKPFVAVETEVLPRDGDQGLLHVGAVDVDHADLRPIHGSHHGTLS